jgi:hypothetical protein
MIRSTGVAAMAFTCLAACGGGGGGEPVNRLEQLADNLSIPKVDSQSLTTTEGTPVAGTVTGRDPDGNGLRYYLSTPPAHGAVSGLPPGPVPGQEGSITGNFVYTPVPGFVGSDTFGFIGNDGDWNSGQGRVGIRVSPKGASVAFGAAKSRDTQAAAGTPDEVSTVIHPLPGHGTRLYALGADGAIPPIEVARTDGAARITESGWFAGQRAVFFRSDGALYLWRPEAPDEPAIVWPTTPGETQLGEIRVSKTGAYLAFVSSKRGTPTGDLYVIDTNSDVGRRIDVVRPRVAGGWPTGLRFGQGESTIAFDLVDDGARWVCRGRLSTEGSGDTTHARERLARHEARCESK